MIEIAILGLGEIGTSLGLALKYQKKDLKRVGFDTHQYAQDNALKTDAVDQTGRGVVDAVKNADIICLALPADQLEPTLKLIGHEMKKDAAVLDFSPIKVAADRLAQQYLKQPSHFLGVYPALKTEYLQEVSREYHTAHEDLFKGGSLLIAPTEKTDPSVVKLAADLGSLAGAYSLFIDPFELDGLLAGVHNLPWLLSSALMNALLAQPSWVEARKAGTKEFAYQTGLMTEERTRQEFASVMGENREGTLRMLNEFIFSLKEYRDAIQNRDIAALESLYEKSDKGREIWLREYAENVWRKEKEEKSERTSMSDQLGQMFLGGLMRKKKDA
jgi:prephenate dehydrogenase